MKATPDRIDVKVFTTHPLRRPEGIRALLDAVESIEELVPTHWGHAGTRKVGYSRERVLRDTAELEGDGLVSELVRRRNPRCEGYFIVADRGLKDITFRFEAPLTPDDMERVFRFGDALAERLAPELAFVHPCWYSGKRSQEYCASSVLKSSELITCGPKAVCARTWLGPRLTALFGPALPIPGTTQRPFGDGVQIDLVEIPRELSYAQLEASQRAAMAHLAPLGLFGDYSTFPNYSPGPAWVVPSDW